MSTLRSARTPTGPRPASTARPAPPDDYETFIAGVQRIAKVDLSQYKRGQMERRIRTFVERKGVKSLEAYLVKLRSDQGELNEFLDRVTINVSQLWRNPEQWVALQRSIVPELAKTGRVRAWSAGCSYGAEAYTLAAVATEAAPKAKITIQGTDIDQRVVARAREGHFSAEDARTAPKAGLERHFERDGSGWRAKAELRKLVRFDQGDLLTMRFPQEAYDLVLCRNTVIYFNDDVRDALHERLATALRPGGILVIGSTERVANAKAIGLTPVRPFTYAKAER